MNEKYTSVWTDNFTAERAAKYDSKWNSKFEKNLKHRQQVELINPYALDAKIWVDYPIGTARLMRSVQRQPWHMFVGIDISDEFLNFASQHRIDCFRGNLFDRGRDTMVRCDLLTCLHTLFAFSLSDQEFAIKKFYNGLDMPGYLICDVVNRACRNLRCDYGNEIVPDYNGLYREDLEGWFADMGFRIIHIQKHDCIDNPKFIKWLKKCGLYRYINWAYFKFRLYRVFDWVSMCLPEDMHSKFLVVAERL